LGRLAQAARDDVIVLAGGNLARGHPAGSIRRAAGTAHGSPDATPAATRGGTVGALARGLGTQVAGAVAVHQAAVVPVRTAITVEVGGDGAAARAGTMRGARIALLGRALLLAAQLGVELAQRGVEAFVDGGAAFGRGLRRGHAGVGAAGRSAPGGPAGARAG